MADRNNDQVSGKPSQAEGEDPDDDQATVSEPLWPVGHPSQAEGEDPDDVDGSGG
ncbi:hypothetical protein [Microbacterium timonense]|jgi:hypothetical protein|uniref:hypothetical protein n=1 Tax=Microbacterium timonense TaxID=2086576 RepID=UPI00190EABD8|nr:hypothetical protein [Microbacterium timonense]